MSNKLVASRYATALLLESQAQGSVDVVEKDLRTVAEIIESSSDLRMLLRSPIIENWRKKKITLEVFDRDISPLTMSFLILIIEKNRENMTRDIVTEFFGQLDVYRNILRVQVDSASVLDERSRTLLTNTISVKSGGKNVQATYGVDAGLIGGVRVTIGDQVFDGSLQYQLSALRERLASA